MNTTSKTAAKKTVTFFVAGRKAHQTIKNHLIHRQLPIVHYSIKSRERSCQLS